MYELYCLSKDFWRCSVEKTFLTSNKSDDLLLSNSFSLAFLASSLSWDDKELRSGDIFHLAGSLSFPGEPRVRAFLQKLESSTLLAWNKKVINALQDQVGWKGFWYWSDNKSAGAGSSLNCRFLEGEWTNPKLSATKVHLNIFQSKQLNFTFLLFIQIILPSKERLSSSLSLSTSSWFPESNWIRLFCF